MSYRSKTPVLLSILKRRLKPGKTIEDFEAAHVPAGDVTPTDCGVQVDFFGVPTRVINAVSATDPQVIYSIGLSYGDLETVFTDSMERMSLDDRGDKLDSICEHIDPPAIAVVSRDNDYGGDGADYQQTPLATVTPELVEAISAVMAPVPPESE